MRRPSPLVPIALALAACSLRFEPSEDARPRPALVVDETLPSPQVPAGGVAKAPTTLQPPESDIIETPDVPLDGAFTIREYVVRLKQPEGAWLSKYDATFGLELGFGETSRFMSPRSTVSIGTNCEGSCAPGEFEARIKERTGPRVFENAKRGGKSVVWVQEPTKRDDGGFWMHLRTLGSAGETISEDLEFVFMSEKSDRGWLYCHVHVDAARLAELEATAEICRALEWSYEGEPTTPVELRFGGIYAVAGASLEFPTPTGFRFARYEPARGQLEFRGEVNILDDIRVNEECHGTCSADRLAQNLTEHVAERIEQLRTEERAPEELVPFGEIAPGRWRQRLRSQSFGDKQSLEIGLWVAPPGASRLKHCEVRLMGESIGRADELEAACSKALSVF